MRLVVFGFAVLLMSSAMVACTSSTQVRESDAATASAPSVPGTMDGLEYLVGDWTVRHYTDQGDLFNTPNARVQYRPLFGDAVLEATRWYDWGIRDGAYIPAQVRWIQRDSGNGQWRVITVWLDARLWFERGLLEDGDLVIEAEVTQRLDAEESELVLERFSVARAKEDGPFELFEPGSDTPLVWWEQTRMHPSLSWSGPRPIAYLERAAAPLAGDEISNDMRVRKAWSGFDFWIGEWDLAWQGGSGTNTIAHEPGPWVVRESFEDAASGFQGGSLTVWSRERKRWRQVWMDNQGAFLIFEGRWEDDQMVLHLINPEDTPNPDRLSRMRWHDITDDALVWTYEGSDDDGATWSTLWEINYTRRQ